MVQVLYLFCCFSLMVSVAIFAPARKVGAFFMLYCPTFDIASWNFLKFYRGWGVCVWSFELWIWKIGIAGVEQCLCARRGFNFIGGGGGRVGFSRTQNDLSQTPHMDTESVD